MIWLLLTLFLQETVENDLKPNNPMKITLVKDLTLGDDEEDDNQIFSNPTTLAVDDEGTMYVLDSGGRRVIVFDKEGKHLRNFGKEGQGPGEFQNPGNITFDHKGRVAVFDTISKRVSLFDRDGNFLEDKGMELGIQAVFGQPFFFENGNSIAGTVKTDAQFQITYDLSLYNPELKTIKSLTSYKLPPTDWSQAGDPSFWVFFLKSQFEQASKGYPMGIALDSKHFMACRSDAYKGEFYDQDGNIQSKFSKKIKPVAFTEDEQKVVFEAMWEGFQGTPLAQNLTKPVFERALAEGEYSDFVAPLSACFPLGDGFAVLANYQMGKELGQLELFDRNGKCIASTEYQGVATYIVGKGNHIYTVGADEDDNTVIHRYLVKGLAATTAGH